MSAARPIPVAYVSLGLAALSLAAALYQGWINSRNLANVQHDIARREHIRACKEIIEAYFEVKARTGLLLGFDLRSEGEAAREVSLREAAVAIGRFAAIGTYLANFQDAATRVRYTELSHELARAVRAAREAPAGALETLYAKADSLFGTLNEDCVRSATAAPL